MVVLQISFRVRISEPFPWTCCKTQPKAEDDKIKVEKCEIGIQTDDLPADPLFEIKSVDDDKHNNSMSSPKKRVELNPLSNNLSKKQS